LRSVTGLFLGPLAALIFLIGFLFIGAAPANGQAASPGRPQILSNEALVDYPHTVTFRLQLAPVDASGMAALAAAWPDEATLTFRVGRQSCLEAGTMVPVEVTGSTLEWTWVMSRSGNPPPGAQIWWRWTVTGAAGATITTPEQSLTFADDRFEWRTISAGGGDRPGPIHLHWYRGDQVGPTLLEAAVAGLDRLQRDTGITLQGEVQIFVYGDSTDMREALLYVQDWAGAVAFSDYNTVLLGVEPGQVESWGRSTIRHELAHLVIGQFGRSCLGGDRPNWLAEGLAVFAEGEPDDHTLANIKAGIQDDTFQPVRSLNGAFPARTEQASAAYSQSYSLVAYLLDTYGQEKMQALLLALAGAQGYDAALEQIYGFNADGLETAWRAAIDAPPRQIPPTPTPILAAAVPTVVPLGMVQSTPRPEPPLPDPAGQEDPSSLPPPSATSSDSLETSDDPSPDASSGICGLPLLFMMGIILVMFPGKRRRILSAGHDGCE